MFSLARIPAAKKTETNLVGRIGGRYSNTLERPRLLVATRIFGASGQPWLWRQVAGLNSFSKEVICWQRHNPLAQPVRDTTVHILTDDPAPYDGARRWHYRLRNLPGRNFYGALGDERLELTEVLGQIRPDAILCYFGDIAMRLAPVASFHRIPLIAYLHGDFCFVSNRWYRWSLKRCVEQFAAIIVVTESERKWILSQGISGDKVHVIPCGAPVDVFRPSGQKNGGSVQFVMASRLSPDKGCEISIAAFARVAAKVDDVQLHIYGDGPARLDLERLVTNLGLEDQVTFHGYVEEARLAVMLPSHDVFIQHSVRKEGSPVSIVETMACGLPVVATPVGGIPEQVAEGTTGLLVPEQDVTAMASAMSRLALDRQLRHQFGQAGRDRAESLFDSAVQLRRLDKVLLTVARPN